MTIIDKTADTLLFTPGRTPCTGPLAIVLHGYSSGIEMLDLEMERCPRPRPRSSPGCHTSFHYGVDGCNVHQYVATANTAWGFGVTPPTCPAPICPPDECASCTGLTVGQYNPDLDGNDPVLPVFVAGTDGTANSCVIHVALTGQSGFSALDAYGDCCRFLERSYDCVVRSLAEIFIASGLTPTQTTLLVHCSELLCLDIDTLIIDINAVIDQPPAPLPSCNCTATVVAPAAICTALATLPTAVTPATVVLGDDCEFHPLPVADITVVGTDTATVDITVVEAPIGTFTVSATVIPSYDLLCETIQELEPQGDAGSVVQVVGTIQGEGTTCGLYNIPVIDILALDTATVNTTVAEAPTGVFTVSSAVNVSATAGNSITQNLDGLYVAIPTNRNEVLVLPNATVITQALLDSNNASTVIITGDVDGQVSIEPPSSSQDKHLWIKNATLAQLDIDSTGGELIDGVLIITLDGTIPAGYPFGNNGGEAVHLVWAGTAWYIL